MFFKKLIQFLQRICKGMIINHQLRQFYEDLGRMTAAKVSLPKKELSSEYKTYNENIHHLLKKINKMESCMLQLEAELGKNKRSWKLF